MKTKMLVILIAAALAVGLLIVLYAKSKESYDPALQYNIVNHPIRQKIMAEADAGNPPAAPTAADIAAMRKKVNDWYTAAASNGKLKPHDKWMKICIDAALDSGSAQNWFIGNVICYMPNGTENDPSKWIEILRGGNRFFARNPKDILAITGVVPRLDSHAHGEMMVLDAFEDRLTRGLYDKSSSNYSLPKNSSIDFRKKNELVGYSMPDNIVLFTQLESCQMCAARIGNSGIARCYYGAPDNAGAPIHLMCSQNMPAYFNMLNRQVHDVADCSPAMIQFAFDAFAGPNAAWVIYCTWKLGQVGSPKNLTAEMGYCKGQFYANNKIGQAAMYDPLGWYRTVDTTGGPKLNCTVTPPTS